MKKANTLLHLRTKVTLPNPLRLTVRHESTFPGFHCWNLIECQFSSVTWLSDTLLGFKGGKVQRFCFFFCCNQTILAVSRNWGIRKKIGTSRRRKRAHANVVGVAPLRSFTSYEFWEAARIGQIHQNPSINSNISFVSELKARSVPGAEF